MSTNIFFSTVLLLLFTIEISGLGWPECYRFTPSRYSRCTRNCPALFPNGRCESYESKWKCICRTSNEKNAGPYTLDEANCIQRVFNGESNPECATQLCPPGFREKGEIRKEDLQWYCFASEFGRPQLSKYTLSEAKRIYNACNRGKASQRKERCTELCPIKYERPRVNGHEFGNKQRLGYEHGQCILDGDDSTLRCGCSILRRLDDVYGIQEANDLASVCSMSVKNDEGCLERCPEGFPEGGCQPVGGYYTCVCRRNDRFLETGYYTIPEVRAMLRVCNSETQDHKGCRLLCPVLYREDGNCYEERGQFECRCKKTDDGPWITLKHAWGLYDDHHY